GSSGGFSPRGFPGSGGGGPTPNGRGPSPLSRGPDFFGSRVTDDPSVPRLYDPQEPSVVHLNLTLPGDGIHPLALVRHEEQQLPPPAGGDTIRGPRSQVTADAVGDLPFVIIRGNNPADVEEVIRIIKLIQEYGKVAEIEIRMVPLESADATSVVNTLN